MKKHYIKAILEMLETGQDISKIIEGLKEVLTAKGHMRLYAAVLRGVLVQLSSQTVSNLSVVTVSSESELTTQKDAIETTLKELDAPNEFESVIDESIIGGHSVSYKNMILDRSYKTTLINLYRSITK